MTPKEVLKNYVAQRVAAHKDYAAKGAVHSSQIALGNAYGAAQVGELLGVIDRSEFMALEMEIFGSQS